MNIAASFLYLRKDKIQSTKLEITYQPKEKQYLVEKTLRLLIIVFSKTQIFPESPLQTKGFHLLTTIFVKFHSNSNVDSVIHSVWMLLTSRLCLLTNGVWNFSRELFGLFKSIQALPSHGKINMNNLYRIFKTIHDISVDSKKDFRDVVLY